MGIPAFFRQIVEKYPKTHSIKVDKPIDHFFIDFNSIVYDVYYEVIKSLETKTTNSKFETLLINAVIQRIIEMSSDVVQPQKTLYLAFDGSAPRAKMVQQRWRRYKGIQEAMYYDELKEKYDIEKSKVEWNTSSNIAPGTKFMKKLSMALKRKININAFSSHKPDITVILSDSSVPGEGEHKFLPLIRDMKGTDDTICIYSPDADMIVLSMATMKNNIWILRRIKGGSEGTEVEKAYATQGHKYLFLSIDEYDDAFIENLDIKGEKKDTIRLITDYIFLTFLGGNDFVMPIPYLVIRKERLGQNRGGLNILMNIYKMLLTNEKDYLVIIKDGKYSVNHLFLTHIFEEISKSEDYYMRGIQMGIDRVRTGQGEERKLMEEEGKTLYEIDRTRYEHYEYYSKLHPEYERYKPIFDKFDFKQPKHIWKATYYDHFFHINPSDFQEYNSYRSKICLNYLEALLFTLKYYFEGVPSWSWHYHFRAPPTISDLLMNMKKLIPNINNITFELNEPYKPFDQLMIILPPQMGSLLPKAYHNLMKNELLQYYPIGFELDVFLGGKHIYSEPILPFIDDKHVKSETEKIALTVDEKARNQISLEPYVKTGSKKKIKISKNK